MSVGSDHKERDQMAYERALAGEVRNFASMNDPYREPEDQEITKTLLKCPYGKI